MSWPIPKHDLAPSALRTSGGTRDRRASRLEGAYGLVLACLWLVQLGCASFNAEDASAANTPTNGCFDDSDCADGARCRENLCITRMPTDLNVTLRITPAYQADGSEPLPIHQDLPRLDGPTQREFQLPKPVTIRIVVTRDGEPVTAGIRIRDMDQLIGMPARTLTSALTDGQEEASVALYLGGRYVVRVEPVDASLPPLSRVIDAASDGDVIAFEYADEMSERNYVVLGAPADAPLLVRAVEPETRRAISSVGQTDSGGRVTLAFGGDPTTPYRLELSPAASSSAVRTQAGCDADTLSPSYQVDSETLSGDPVLAVSLPQLGKPVRYEGTVKLCGNGEASVTPETARTLTLGVSLRSTSLLLDPASESTDVTASFVSETTTDFDPETGLYKFCTLALPGQYDVVVSPPTIAGACLPDEDVARCGCGIFAEARALEPGPDGEVSPTAIELPTMASISGELTTESQDPVEGATIEAMARAATDGINLGDLDKGITTYNRSSRGTSGAGGLFRVPLDVGAYDVTIKPPSESGFAWLVVRDVRIANRSAEFSTVLTMGAPISVDGALRYSGGDATSQASLAGAVVRAYSIVEEADVTASKRAIEIGQAIADESGAFMLLLSPLQRQGWLW